MISVAYALLLVSLAFGTVPEAWAAPVGTRSVHVKTMRRMPFEREHMRRAHHSATSVVQRDDVPVAVVAREPEPTLKSVPVVAREPATTSAVVAAREPAPSVSPIPVTARDTSHSTKSAPVVARHEGHHPKSATSDTTTPETKRLTRRHHAKNEARGAPAAPRALPRFKRDEAERRSASEDKKVPEKRKTSASDANVAREPSKVAKTQEKREPEKDKVKEKREPAPQPTPVRPIMMFRRALAFEDLD